MPIFARFNYGAGKWYWNTKVRKVGGFWILVPIPVNLGTHWKLEV